MVERPDGVPAELADPSAPVWHDPAAADAYFQAHGWTLPAADRMPLGDWPIPANPENRRRRAAAQWAVEDGITRRYETNPHPHPDGPALKRMGLW